MYDRAVIQQELDSILSSHLFKNKRQAGKFLGYIVQEFIEDRGQDITQYSIAVEALAKRLTIILLRILLYALKPGVFVSC